MGRAPSLTSLRREAASCRACPLWADATQTVFGAGRASARLMLVGEQPGDREDREGEPFVGPAGGLLDRALEEAGIDRDEVYVTNAVKHFRYRNRGKRRIHQRPAAEHIAACRPWLDGELRAVRPDVLVCLGVVAAKALLGPTVRVTSDRGTPWPASELADAVFVTVHPSSLLRVRPPEERETGFRAFVADLRTAAGAVTKAAA